MPAISAGSGSVGPWTKQPGSATAARSASASQPGAGAQSSSVNATRSASLARQPSSRAVAGPAGERALDRPQRQLAPRPLGGEHRRRRGGRAVRDHDDLVGGPLLPGQRPQKALEPGGAIVRRDDDGDRRSHSGHAYQ